MGLLLIHLFPTVTAFLFFLQFVRDLSLTSFLIYAFVAIVGGWVYASQIMFTDNRALASLGRATQDLALTGTEIESHEEFLPEPAVSYVNRFLFRSKRMTECVFVKSVGRTFSGPRAFSFTRFVSVCLHSIGSPSELRGTSRLILYHEFGHLFIHQPRSGLLAVILGDAIPLYVLVLANEASRTDVYFALGIWLGVEAVMALFLDKHYREIFADYFALACWFTDRLNEWPCEKVEHLHRGRVFFKEMPSALVTYERYVVRRSVWRKRAFRRGYRRMNRIGWLNRKFHEWNTRGGGEETYFQEVFFRRLFLEVGKSTKFWLVGLKLGAIIYFLLQLPMVEISIGIAFVMFGCAVVMFIFFVSSFAFLDENSGLEAQMFLKKITPIILVEEVVDTGQFRKKYR